MEYQKSLQPRTVIGNASHLVQNLVNELLPDRVVATSIVVGRVLFTSNHVFGVEKTAVGAGAHLVDYIRFKVTVDSARNVLALPCRDISSCFQKCDAFERTRLREEGAEALVVVGSFTLLGEKPIGLSGRNVSGRSLTTKCRPLNIPGYRAPDSRAIRVSS